MPGSKSLEEEQADLDHIFEKMQSMTGCVKGRKIMWKGLVEKSSQKAEREGNLVETTK